MFKYFILIFDYFLTICFELSMNQFSIFVLIPPILHTLTLLIKPHCYVNHCKLTHKSKIKQQQHKNKQQHNNTPQKINQFGQTLNYLSPFKLSDPLLSLPSGSPSPSPFQPQSISNKKYDNLSQSQSNKSQKYQNITKKQPINTNPNPNTNTNIQQYEQCKQCGLIKWIRMHHCYYCQVCIHKYDHHCILLGICIGQANQKYYLPFLWTFFFNSILQVYNYYQIIQLYLWIDQNGYQHTQWLYIGISLLIIFFVLSTIIVGYLSIYHTYLMLYNDTTYQMKKRGQIYYFKGIIKQHPFDKGILENIRLILIANNKQPIQWQKPQKIKIGNLVNVKQNRRQSENNVDRKRKSLAQRRGFKIQYQNISGVSSGGNKGRV